MSTSHWFIQDPFLLLVASKLKVTIVKNVFLSCQMCWGCPVIMYSIVWVVQSEVGIFWGFRYFSSNSSPLQIMTNKKSKRYLNTVRSCVKSIGKNYATIQKENYAKKNLFYGWMWKLCSPARGKKTKRERKKLKAFKKMENLLKWEQETHKNGRPISNEKLKKLKRMRKELCKECCSRQ